MREIADHTGLPARHRQEPHVVRAALAAPGTRGDGGGAVTDCAAVRDDLGGYVLDALEPAEREAVAAHLATCPACARRHAELAGLPQLVATRGGARDPASAAAGRGAAARHRGPRAAAFRAAAAGRRLRFTRGVALAAGAVLGAAVTALALQLTDDGGGGPAAGYDVALARRRAARRRGPRSSRTAAAQRCGSGCAASRPAVRWSTRSCASGPAGARAPARSAPTRAAAPTCG